MNKGLKRVALLLAVSSTVLVVGGCANGIQSSSKIERGPVGVGRSINELKGTPCACTEIPMSIPDHMKV